MKLRYIGQDGQIYNEVRGANGTNSLQYLIYESASYHGTINNTVKNKAPTYGQDALDMFFLIKDTSTHRIDVDYKTNEIVVFDNTINNTYYGHVRSWQELTQAMKNTLIKNGVTDNKGRIITR